MQDPDTRFARNREGHVAYQIVGDGPHDLVFVPSWANNVDAMWEEPSLARYLRRLAAFSRLICFDKRGTGVSDPVPLAALPTLEQWMEDICTVMAAAGSKRAALLGDAEGGQMAMLFAATYPERVSSLVLVNTAARHLRDADYPWGLPARSVPAFLDQLGEIWGTGGVVDFLAPNLAHDARFRRWYSRYERLALSPRAAVALYAAQFERDLRSVLPTIRVPTLVLHRAENPHFPVGHGRYLAAHIPGAKYVELAGAGHYFHLDESGEMLTEIEEFLTGVRPVVELDRVLATVLFTDIVGSTERAAALGDRSWRALLEAHHVIVRRELNRHRGREVDTAGDGFMVTFDGPARAIRCASAIRDAVRTLGIEIRAGLHTGECQLMGNYVGGIAVHIGARVAKEAGAGEVLVSSTVKDLVAGSGIRFVDRGSRRLKGVPGEWRLFAAEGLRLE